jgi:hypothetical protein
MPAAKNKLEKLPGFSVGVRVNAAARMVKLARPVCPNSKLRMIKNEQGNWVRDENQPQNCQLSDEPRWWDRCEELGHNPYFQTIVWYEPQDIVDEDEDGNLIVKGQKRIKHTSTRPNVAQVALHLRVNSGKGAKFKIERHGFKRLSEIGYEEVCQFRNCQKPLTEKGRGGVFGNYCSVQHLQLIAADAEGVMLHYPSSTLNADEYSKVQKLRAKQLREAAASA